MAYMTFTPLLGMSDVVKRFLLDRPPGTGVVTMTIDDAEHYTAEQRRKEGIPIEDSTWKRISELSERFGTTGLLKTVG